MGPEYTMELIPRTQYMFESDKDPLTLFNPKFLVCVCACVAEGMHVQCACICNVCV